jgi:outer membrane protein assembly factor BamB
LVLTLAGCGESKRPGDEADAVSATAHSADRSQSVEQLTATARGVQVTKVPTHEEEAQRANDRQSESQSDRTTTEPTKELESDQSTGVPADDPEPTKAPADDGAQKSMHTAAPDRSGDWPQFRGVDGQGHGAAGGLPIRWNDKKNITWKVPIRGSGWSSPVIADNKIWLTTAIVLEKSLRVLCLDAQTGATLHDVEVFQKDSLGGIHPKNSHASPTPLVGDDRCYVHFGSHGTAALNTQGEILWKTELKYYHHHGPGGSPTITDGALFIACDGMTKSHYDDRTIAGVTDAQFVVALETASGDIRWKAKRDGAHSYTTPLVIEVAGQKQVVAPGGKRVVAYNPSTGAEIWSCGHEGYSLVPRPVFGLGLVFVCTGYDAPTLLAIRPNGHGDVTNTHIVWKSNQGVPLNPSPILIGDELYTISDQGVASCLDGKTGKVHWRRRLGGNHSTSPLFADGKLYVLDEVGTTHVLSPGTKCKILAKNLLRGKTLASLAASGRALYLRTDSHLYRIEDATGKPTDNGDVPPSEAEETPQAE